jgi:FkbM family methyltransferase
MFPFENSQEGIDRYLNQEVQKRFIFGTGKFAKLALDSVDFNSFVEDNPGFPTLDGRPIIETSKISPGSVVLVASSNNPFSAAKRLRLLGHTPVHILYFIKHVNGENLFFPEFEQDYLQNPDNYSGLDESLEDEESRRTLKKLISFRLSGDINEYFGLQSTNPHYFEDFLNLGEGEVFYDVGAYDGQNSIEFTRRVKSYEGIYAFEPNPRQHQELGRLVEEVHNFHLMKVAVADFDGEVGFTENLGMASKIQLTDQGRTTFAEAVKLDTASKRILLPTFIKFDIEGFELKALHGASEILKDTKPKLAISIYHYPLDLIEIYLYLSSLFKSAKYYLRHYSEGTDETVLFCIPN